MSENSVDPLALHAALTAADGEEAREFLRRQAEVAAKQSRLLDLQIDTLQKVDGFENSHLRWRRLNDQMGGALQIMLVLVGILIVAGLGAAVWNAASDNGLVIEAFSVPPDLAARGLTGEVVAGKVLDRLIAFQEQTVSGRASASYANNWGGDIKVQIPNTGVSIGEFTRMLHQWLGHGTRITGDVYRTPAGIAISARIGGKGGAVFKGSEAELDALVERAAEHVYRQTQPYRYAIYLGDHKRFAEETAVLNGILAEGSALERGWALIGLTSVPESRGDFAASVAINRQAMQTDPGLVLPYFNNVFDEQALQHDEEALAGARAALAAAAAGDASMSERPLAGVAPWSRAAIAQLTGDQAGSLAALRTIEAQSDFNDSREGARQQELVACAALHDIACLRAVRASLLSRQDVATVFARRGSEELASIALEHWDGWAKDAADFYVTLLHAPPPSPAVARLLQAPIYALAAAHAGDLKTAHSIIDTTPPDCVLCLRFRGQIDSLEHNWSGAAWWFGRAAAAAPSVPYAHLDWGRMLLQKGDPGGAMAHFARASSLGPKFADPLEMWGEALIVKNRSDLALEKFGEAARYAPNWGRLHLKWGEALGYVGRKDEAKAQYQIASTLDLSVADKDELARCMRG